MDNQPLVSMIIPLYNTERYIEQCIRSLTEQTYQNIEIIVVNDGSTDRSPLLVEKLAAQDKRIRLITKENAGVSAARNTGIDAARGDFIAFCDADDAYYPDAVAFLLEAMTPDVDLTVGSHDEIFIKTHPTRYDDLLLIKAEFDDGITQYYRQVNFVWGNLYRASVIRENGVSFNESISFSEDMEFNFDYIRHCRSLRLCRQVVYRYYISRGGNHARIDHPAHSIDVVCRYFDGQANMPPVTYRFFVKRYLKHCLNRYISWYPPKQTAALLKDAYAEASAYVTEDILKEMYTEHQTMLILSDRYEDFVNDYLKEHPVLLKQKRQYARSRRIVGVLKRIHYI